MKVTPLTRVMLVVVLVLMGIAGWQQYWIQSHTPKIVLNYPEQEVKSRLPGIEEPAVALGSVVVVLGTKCNTGTVPVPLSGFTSWQSVLPPGTTYQVSRGSTNRLPGCVSTIYENPIPNEVAARVREYYETSGQDCMWWQIVGKETPDSSLVVPASWLTEPFLVCRNNTPRLYLPLA